MGQFKTVAEYKEEWTRSARSRFPLRGERLPHATTASAFTTELQQLFRATGDMRFREVFQALKEHNLLTEAGEWTRDLRWDPLEGGLEIIESVDRQIQRGGSRTLAFAWAATFVEANSFEAAMKQVERYWREYRDRLDTSSGENVQT